MSPTVTGNVADSYFHDLYDNVMTSEISIGDRPPSTIIIFLPIIQVDGANVKLILTARGPPLISLKVKVPPGVVFISPAGDKYFSDDDYKHACPDFAFIYRHQGS